MAEVASERRLGQLGERAGQLDPGRPAADDHKGQKPPPFRIILAVLGAFEGDEDAAPHRRCILDILEARCRRRPFVMPEIKFPRAGCDDPGRRGYGARQSVRRGLSYRYR